MLRIHLSVTNLKKGEGLNNRTVLEGTKTILIEFTLRANNESFH